MPFIDETQFKGEQYKSSKEENEKIYVRMCAGEESARDELITRNIRFVVDRVNSFLCLCPKAGYLGDDLQSAGLLGLTTAAEALFKREDSIVRLHKKAGAVNAYLCRAIDTAIYQAVEDDHVVQMSRRTRTRWQQHGALEEVILQRAPFNARGKNRANDPRVERELYDELLGCCETQEDKTIIDRRIAGWTDQEISDYMGVSRVSVLYARHALYERYLERTSNE